MSREGWLSMSREFDEGASFHGNWPACVQAERALERFTGGQPCPDGCGTIIRYRVGRPREESVEAHLRDPARCRKYPQSRKARASARAAREASKVSAAAFRQ